MTELQFSNTLGNKNQLVFGVAASDQSSSITAITAQYVPLIEDATGGEDPPVTTPSGQDQPPLPLSFRPPGYVEPVFDYLQLPRLKLQPSNTINTLVEGVKIFADGSDISSTFNSLDWSTPIRGISLGSLKLYEVVGQTLDPEDLGIGIESIIEIKLVYRSLEELVTKAFIVSSPKYYLDSSLSTYVLEIELGCQLQLYESSNRIASLYCGPSPSTAGEAANIYARTRGLRTRLYPRGHDIVEPVINNFTEESAYSFLQQLYDPSNKDVRCNNLLDVVCPERKLFNQASAIPVSFDQVIENNTAFSTTLDNYNTVKVSNEFISLEPFQLQRTTSKTISGNVEDDRPWFQGGYTETELLQVRYGDTVVYKKETQKGYVPTDAQPWSKADVEGDPCDPNAFTTDFQTINEKVESLRYSAHESGSFIITKEQKWEDGKLLKPIDNGDNFELFDGRIAYTTTDYTNSAQINSEVCPKDYLWIQQTIDEREFKLNDEFVLYRDRTLNVTYQVRGVNPAAGQDSFIGVGQTWSSSTTTGQFDPSTNSFIVQPVLTEEDVSPPTARWVRPVKKEILNFTQVTLSQIPGDKEPSPISGPFCYTRGQLINVGNIFLRDSYGIANSLFITVPWNFPGTLGSSILYTNRKGVTRKYSIFNIETNITNNSVSKTYTLKLEV